MKKLILFVFISFVLWSCITERKRSKICAECKPASTVNVHTKDSIYVHDTMIITTVQQDSSLLEMLIKCDSIGKVSLEITKQQQGKRVETKYVFKDNLLKINAYTDSLRYYKQIISTYKESRKDSLKIDRITVYECKSELHILYKYGFWILLSIIVLYIAFVRMLKTLHL